MGKKLFGFPVNKMVILSCVTILLSSFVAQAMAPDNKDDHKGTPIRSKGNQNGPAASPAVKAPQKGDSLYDFSSEDVPSSQDSIASTDTEVLDQQGLDSLPTSTGASGAKVKSKAKSAAAAAGASHSPKTKVRFVPSATHPGWENVLYGSQSPSSPQKADAAKDHSGGAAPAAAKANSKGAAASNSPAAAAGAKASSKAKPASQPAAGGASGATS